MESDNSIETIEKVIGIAPQMMAQLLAAAQPGAVFSAPLEVDGHLIVLASEVGAGGGFGSGVGLPSVPSGAHGNTNMRQGGGSGMGGGGGSRGRPVAVIVIGPGGKVKVQPIVDVTRIVLTVAPVVGLLWAALRYRSKE